MGLMNCVVGDICLLLLGREQFPSFSGWECPGCDTPPWGVTLRGRPAPICARASAALLFFFFGLRCHFSEEKVVVLHHLSCKLSSFYISSVKQALVLRTTCCYFNKSTVTFQTYQDGFIMVQQLCFPHASRPPNPGCGCSSTLVY